MRVFRIRYESVIKPKIGRKKTCLKKNENERIRIIDAVNIVVLCKEYALVILNMV